MNSESSNESVSGERTNSPLHPTNSPHNEYCSHSIFSSFLQNPIKFLDDLKEIVDVDMTTCSFYHASASIGAKDKGVGVGVGVGVHGGDRLGMRIANS